ncbi:MAG TPA: glycoside hydrolase family 3 C-terminal domain-containing protein [Cellulomonas sp.]
MPFDEDRVLATLTLQEKASLTSGADFWHTEPVARAGVPSIMMTDGPHGLRKQVAEGGAAELGESVPATCFPTAAALASTWDPALVERVGEALGREAAAQGVAVLLGPGVNIKRTPLCGRNFEYFSEDPHLAGRLAAAYVAGVQSQGVGTSLKHFAVNNQETDRMRVSADVDERTLREIYLPAFEHVVTTAPPWTVMCAYNKVSGVYASEHGWLLTSVLRDEWGFDGLVVSDWGAVHDRVASLAAGLDLQMPGVGPRPDMAVVGAVVDGQLDEDVLDASVRRVLRLVGRSRTEPAGELDVDAHHALAREAAAGGAVLLKNDAVDGRPLLPLPADEDVLVVGELARTPRYQGAGSSQVNPTRLDDALTALRAEAGHEVAFAPGYTLTGSTFDDMRLRSQAVDAARQAGTVVLFLGLLPADESEGYDRERLDLPANQVRLLAALAEVNRRVVVVLANGSVVSLTGWRRSVPAILETWLGGQAGGSAVADLLTGRRAPEGRLAETIPHRLADTPAYGTFPGEYGHVRYGEGVLVGYRWYDARDVAVAYPFGHGLTYTTFAYDEVTASASGDGADIRVDVSVRVTNTGPLAGAEVVQVYVRDPHASVVRPPRELRAFGKVRLAPGEAQTVTFTLGARDLSFWHPALRRWIVEGGEFVVEVGASSRDIRGSVTLDVAGESAALPLDAMSTVAEWLAHPVGGPLLTHVAQAAGYPLPDDEMLRQIPLEVAMTFAGGAVPPDALAQLVAVANAPAM